MVTNIVSTPTDSAPPFTVTNQTLLVTASGAILASGSEDAVVAGYAGDAVFNSGTIAGYYAMDLGGSYDVVTNNRGGVIEGADSGIYTEQSADHAMIVNHGDISAGSGSGFGGTALLLNSNTATITNDGTIEGSVALKLNSGSGDSIFNSGTIIGTQGAVQATSASNVAIHNTGVIQGDVAFSAGSNVIDGFGGTVEGNITGGSGNDLFDFSHQTVTGTITGGGGSDTIAFASASGAFAIDLGDGTAYGAGEAFTFTGIENATGSAYADTINGDDSVNTISGGAGNDTINGNGGADVINAGPGVDTVMGGPGNDVINGNGGADILNGNGGTDIIIGGAGADTLTGGAGNDTFVYSLITDSPVTGPDRITDFVHGQDKIDLTALHLPSPGDVTITASGGVSNVNIDVNNDGTVDMLIQVVGSIGLTDIITAAAPAALPHSVAPDFTRSAVHHDLATSLHAVAVDHGMYG